MSNFRKKMHIAYKKKTYNIITSFLVDASKDFEEFEKGAENYIEKWIDSNCLPMGDFSKEDALKEIEEWQK